MAIKYIATMAMDLGLHEHMEQHKAGTPCKLPRADCLMHNRIWQTIAGLELIIGGPQGRSDFLCDYETIDMTFPFPSAELDAFEYQTARRYAIMAQCVKNVKMTNNLMQAGKRAKNPVWALSPDFQRHNEDYLEWPKALPQDMQIQYPEDGSPPWLGGDHFVANVHAYHHLAVIMHHRPQLQTLLEKHKPEFKNSLDICTEAAVMVCKLQEALLRDFGLHGLLFMLRGINFTVYCDYTNPLARLGAKIASAYTYSMGDCIEVCAGYNFWNAGSNCTVAAYQPAGDRPGNCWIGIADVTLSDLKTLQGTDVALLDGS